MQNLPPLLSISYFSPIIFYIQLANNSVVYIENDENYLKQTYRNRCEIYAANGKLSLSVPIRKSSNAKIKIRDVMISYETNWQKLHFKSIESAYRSSPFYEFYIDDMHDFFIKKPKFLFDLNLQIIQKFIEILNIKPKICFTEKWIEKNTNEYDDFRYRYNPKKEISKTDVFLKYTQVFYEKHGFISNLSILDLIFNEGPNAITFLKTN